MPLSQEKRSALVNKIRTFIGDDILERYVILKYKPFVQSRLPDPEDEDEMNEFHEAFECYHFNFCIGFNQWLTETSPREWTGQQIYDMLRLANINGEKLEENELDNDGSDETPTWIIDSAVRHLLFDEIWMDTFGWMVKYNHQHYVDIVLRKRSRRDTEANIGAAA